MTTEKRSEIFRFSAFVSASILSSVTFRINLGGFYLTVSEHFADCFKGYAMGKCYFRSVCMTGGMKDQRTVYVADLRNLFQIMVQHRIAVHRQQLVIGSSVAVLLQNL